MTKYPREIRTEHDQVLAFLDGEVYVIRFPYSPEAVARAKEVLKAPKFDPKSKDWRVKKRWHNSLPDGLAAIADEVRKVEEQRAPAIQRAKDLPESNWIYLEENEIVVGSFHHEKLADFCQSCSGRWDRKGDKWSVPVTEVDRVIEQFEEISSWSDEAVEEKNARLDAERFARETANDVSRKKIENLPENKIIYLNEENTITGGRDLIIVDTCYDEDIVDFCRSCSGKWNSYTRTWALSLSHAGRVVEEFENLRARHEAAFGREQAALELARKKAANLPESQSVYLNEDRDRIVVDVDYDEDIVEFCRSCSGFWNRKAWILPITEIDRVLDYFNSNEPDARTEGQSQ